MFCWTKEVAIVGKKKSFNSGQHTHQDTLTICGTMRAGRSGLSTYSLDQRGIALMRGQLLHVGTGNSLVQKVHPLFFGK